MSNKRPDGGITNRLVKLLPLTPSPIIRSLVSAGIHRVILRIVIGRVGNITPHTPANLRWVNSATLQRLSKTTVPSKVTMRTIVIDDTQIVREHLDRKFGETYNMTDKSFGKYVEEELFPKINNALYRRIHISDLDEFELNVLEEYTHYSKDSSLMTYIDACSWAFRTCLMYLTEGFYRKTPTERSIDSEALTGLRTLGSEWIYSLTEDPLYREAFSEVLTHYCYIKLYGIAIKPILEGVTLALLEDDPLEKAEARFRNDPKLLDEIEFYIKRSLTELKEGDSREVKVLVESTQKALNPPIEVIETLRSHGGELVFDLWSLIRDRFEKAVEGKEVVLAKREERGLGVVFNYLTKPTGLNDAIIDLLLSKMVEVKGLPEYLLETFSKSQLRFEKPSVFVRLSPLKSLRFDPWADVSRLTNMGINDLGDIIGPLIPFHKLIVDMVYHKAGSFILQGKMEKNEYLQIILGMITYMGNLQNEVIDWLVKSAPEIAKLEKILDFTSRPSLGEYWNEESFPRYLSTWFELLKDAASRGPLVLKNILTLSQYIHGVS